MESLAPLLKKAKEGDDDAMTLLLMKFDNLILKHSKDSYGSFDEDCYQVLAERFIKAVYKFDLNRK